LFELVSCIPQNELIVLAGDMNGHVGSSNVGCDEMHGRYGYGDRNADGSRILEFTNGTYVAGSVKSVVDYIIVQQGDKSKVCNVKLIPNKECVPKHKLLVIDMQFNITKRWHKKFKPRMRVWKLKEEKTYEEHKSMVKDKVEDAEWNTLM